MGSTAFHIGGALLGSAAAAAYVCVGLIGLALHRHRLPQTWLFTLTCCAFAWATAITPLQPLVGPEHPEIYVLSTALSGYGPVALLLFTSRALAQRRALSLSWLLLGMPGTLFAVVTVALPDGLAFLTAYHRGEGPQWHRVVSPLYAAHLFQCVVTTGVSTVLVLRALPRAAEGAHKSALRWLAAAHVVGWVGLAVYGVLPALFHILWVLEAAPWFLGTPTVALLFRSLNALAEASSARTRAEAATRHLASVSHALRGLSERVARDLSHVAEHAESLSVPEVPRADRRAHASAIRTIGLDAERTLQRMLRFAGPAAPTDARARVASRIRSLAVRAPRVRVTIDPSVQDATVRIEADAIDVALDALLENALHAAHPDRPLEVRIDAHVEDPAVVDPRAIGADLPRRPAVRIRVSDNGTGMSPQVLEQALVPFFTTRPGASGLGLVDVLTTTRRAEGALLLESRHGEGTTVTLWLPVHAEEPSPRAPHPARPRVEGIALVGADPREAELLCLFIGARGRDCSVFAVSDEASELADAPGTHTVVLTLSEADPGAEALARRLLTTRTDVDVTLVGASAHLSRELRLLAGERVHALPRSVRPGVLAAHVIERDRALRA